MGRYAYALEAEGLGKAYRMFPGPLKRIAEALTLGRYRGHHEFWALRDVNARLLPGSTLGLCGANGAGKSTLLKVLAGTTAPTKGRYRIDGRVASLLELGAGFHMEFTGRANIVMNGVMMSRPRSFSPLKAVPGIKGSLSPKARKIGALMSIRRRYRFFGSSCCSSDTMV